MSRMFYGGVFFIHIDFGIYTPFRMLLQFVPESLSAIGSLHTVNRVWANCDLCSRLALNSSTEKDPCVKCQNNR